MNIQSSGRLRDRISSFLLFLVSNIFFQKLNAIGIANLPVFLRTLKTDSNDLQKVKKYALSLFHGSVVASGLFNFYPTIIKIHALLNICFAVHASIEARREEEEKAKQKESHHSFTGFIKKYLFWSHSSKSKADDEKNDKETSSKKKKTLTAEETAQKGCHKARQILAGHRDSATDDILWGVFQAVFVFYHNQTYLQALWHAWMVLLLTILEEAIFNPKLNRKQKGRRILWIVVTGYLSGKLVF